MKCEEFKQNIVELCDKNPDAEILAECMRHIEECAECKAYYDDYMATVDMLRPRHTPMTIRTMSPQKEDSPSIIERKHSIKPIRTKLARIATALIIFVAGIITGWSNLFTTDAKANVSPSFLFEQAIRNVQNVGSFIINVNARTLANENMAYFNPDVDFVKISLKVLHQNDSTFWRLEKEGGRTILFDGKEQYMWDNNGTRVRGSADVAFLEGFVTLLSPEKLLRQQKAAMADSNAKVETLETDSTTIIMAYMEIYDNNLLSLLNDSEQKKQKCTIENVFSKNDGLLRQIRIWVEYAGKKVLLLSSSDIKYNISLDKKELLQLPDTNSEWQLAQEPLLNKGARLQALQKETATEAAQRIVTALTTGNIQQAEEALYYYKPYLPNIIKNMEGCKASEFSDPKKRDDYAGVYVFYKLTHTDGTSEMQHIAIRCDNDQKIWMVDGGL